MRTWRSVVSHLRARGHVAKGNAARAAREWAAAASAYGLALELCPDLWPIWVQYGHMLKESGDKAAASSAYDRALALHPEAVDTHLQVGHLRKLQNNLDGAAASYARALELDPGMVDAALELRALMESKLEASSAQLILHSSMIDNLVLTQRDHSRQIDDGSATLGVHSAFTRRSLGVHSARLQAVAERTVEHSAQLEAHAAALNAQRGKLDGFEGRVAAYAATLAGCVELARTQSGKLEYLANRLIEHSSTLGGLLKDVSAQACRFETYEGRNSNLSAAIDAVAEKVNGQRDLFDSVEGRVSDHAARLAILGEQQAAAARLAASEVAALRKAENERFTDLRVELDRHFAASAETHRYLVDRVEFVRRELLYEFKYRGRGAEPGAALAVKSKVINEEKYKEFLRSGRVVLNVGCGHIIQPDCLNVDRRELPGIDVIAEADELPFEQGTVDEIRSSHLLEHFPEEALMRGLLPHWHGRLKPGGSMRAIVPDGEAMLSEHAAGRYPFDDLREVLYGSQDYDGDFHFNLLTPSSLRSILEATGFRQIELVESGRRNGRCFEFEIVAIA